MMGVSAQNSRNGRGKRERKGGFWMYLPVKVKPKRSPNGR